MFTRAALKSYFIQIEYEPFKLSKQCGAQFKQRKIDNKQKLINSK